MQRAVVAPSIRIPADLEKLKENVQELKLSSNHTEQHTGAGCSSYRSKELMSQKCKQRATKIAFESCDPPSHGKRGRNFGKKEMIA